MSLTHPDAISLPHDGQTRPITQERMAIKRNGMIEILRILGAIGIVWFHTGAPGHGVAYAALPMFIVMSLVLLPHRDSFGAFLHNRVRRLLWPWLLWSVLYAALFVWSDLHHGLPILAWFHWNMLLVGTVLPLWFLPFLFVCSVIFQGVESCLAGRAKSTGAGAAFIGLVLLGILLPAVTWIVPQSLPVPLEQWRFGLVSAVYGFAARRCAGAPVWLALVFLVLSLSVLTVGDGDAFAIWLGVGVALIGGTVRIGFRPWMAFLGPASFLVYLAHPAVILLIYSVAGPLGPIWMGLSAVGLSLSLALVVIWLGWQHVLL